MISGKEVPPLVEGGKGIAVSNGESCGAWASAGGVGTFSGVNADAFDANGALIPVRYGGRTRRERHEELRCAPTPSRAASPRRASPTKWPAARAAST